MYKKENYKKILKDNNLELISITKENSRWFIEYFCKIHGIQKQRLDAFNKCKKCSMDNSQKHRRNSHETFLNKFKIKNPELFKNVKIIDTYVSQSKKILVENKYGICMVYPTNLFSIKNFKIQSAIDKTQYFKNMYLEKFGKIDFEILSDFDSMLKYIIIKDSYGICKIYPNNLMSGSLPNILSAIDKNSYIINKLNKIHDSKYEYNDFKYEGMEKTILTIKCRNHGEFTQPLYKHMGGNGCPLCRNELSGYTYNDWVLMAEKSKKFDSFKLYKIQCFNTEENFFKVGITFLKIKDRFISNRMPYNYKIIDVIESKDSKYIWDLEKKLHKKYKDKRYVPKIKFNGFTECFTVIEDILKEYDII